MIINGLYFEILYIHSSWKLPFNAISSRPKVSRFFLVHRFFPFFSEIVVLSYLTNYGAMVLFLVRFLYRQSMGIVMERFYTHVSKKELSTNIFL